MQSRLRSTRFTGGAWILLRRGVFNTPVYGEIPDVQAGLRLLETFDRMHGIDVDSRALEQFSGEVEKYYRELEDRLETVSQPETPEDRVHVIG